MKTTLLHIFRNIPIGRETLLQTIYFCSQIGVTPVVYIPEFTKFLMYFENDVVQIDLDGSYLKAPETAKAHVEELFNQYGMKHRFLSAKNYTASNLPDIPIGFDFMVCPRSISDLTAKIGLGYIGPRVRRIVKSARFPVLISSSVFKKWKRIAVFFGGSENSVNALTLGFRIQRKTDMKLDVYTQLEKTSREELETIIKSENLEKDMEHHVNQWHIFDSGSFEENMYQVPHDALAVVGAFGHGLIKELLFGSKMEEIQTTLPNNMLIAGPQYTSS